MSGYAPPNYTQTPNALFDLDMQDMSEAELKCTLAIIRKTLGYHKDGPEAISYSQIEQLTGLSRQSVIEGVKAAVRRGRIKRAGRGTRGVHLYAVNFDDQSSLLTGTGQESRPDLVNEVDSQNKGKERSKESSAPESGAADESQRDHTLATPDPTPVQPHIAIIDAYIEAMGDRCPIVKNPYKRWVAIASSMHKRGITAEEVGAFVSYLYDPVNPDGYWSNADHSISLETVAAQLPNWKAKRQQNGKPKPFTPAEVAELQRQQFGGGK